jgi:hypothetical protein
VAVPETIAKITFVPVDGNPPEEFGVERLPDATAVASIIENVFSPFAASGELLELLATSLSPAPPKSGLHLIYVYGHAWLDSSTLHIAPRTDGAPVTETASHLTDRLLEKADLSNTIIVLDCCHAAAFDSFVERYEPRLAVYASGRDEKAIALHGDKASRLSLALAAQLRGKSRTVDLIAAVAAITDPLGSDGVIRGQTVSYRAHGPSFRLARGSPATAKRRERTVALIRNALLGTGAVVAFGIVWAGWYYWNHTVIEIDFASLGDISDNVTLTASVEHPETNGREVFSERTVNRNGIRLWAPSDNILLKIDADYKDGEERALAYHMVLEPGFSPSNKFLDIVLPAAGEVERHPGMAHIPATSWYHGRERDRRRNEQPFWIDIRPPTVKAYLPVALKLSAEGALGPEGSLLVDWRERSGAVDAVGLDQLRNLNSDLGEILGIIDSATSDTVSSPGDVATGLGEVPCDQCPAPMLRHEAELYCERQGKRLPTGLEWELAVRGVDGRTYPWGNQFDQDRANVPGLPDKGEAPPALEPVDAYPDERSPFGLIDTVGNAGDWVIADYDRTYMGATYRFNQEDATAFRSLPVTDADFLMREITARCVSEE